MISSTIHLIPLSYIDFPESRQRQEINFDKVYEYATSIAQQGLLHDIGVNEEEMILVWGGHRYTAFSLLNDIDNEKETALTAQYTAEQIEELRKLITNSGKSFDQISAKLIKDASPLLLSVLELSENLNRHDLSWQEKASAVETIHKQAVADAREQRQLWVDADTARLIGCSRELVSQLLTPTRKLAAITDPKIKEKAQAALKDSKSALSASNAVETIAQRHGVTTNAAMNLGIQEKAQQTKKEEKPVIVTASLGQRSILCANFNEWAASYEGPKFNFVHCDFPYGVDFNKGTGMNTSTATRNVGEYDDGEEIYWDLLCTLLNNRSKLLADSAHIMFWLSVGVAKLDGVPIIQATRGMIRGLWPDAHISSIPLIWHCADNSGLLPDSRREPRRTYEWAIKITLGDRPLAKPVAASFSYPRNSDMKLHRSQKHQAVLQHFFQLFVDSSTRMLDPTCGSGTSVLTAHMMKAESVLGLELNPEMRESAVKNFDEVMK